ncbi:DNA-directed RNA polymerase specialized sigma subunit [Lachnospiraceae bacterium KHCPX20]|nr:DNA-directed RNA polymerase specialized sigma subunit [Lachnospiraceae bacterium KHCPX20]
MYELRKEMVQNFKNGNLTVEETIDYVEANKTSTDDEVLFAVVELCGALWKTRLKSKEQKLKRDHTKCVLTNIAGGKYGPVSEEVKKTAFSVLWSCIEQYALKMMHGLASSYVATNNRARNKDNVDEMLNECCAMAIASIEKYDETRAAPLTFFKNAFTHAILDWKKEHESIGASPGINNMIRRVTNTEYALRAEGVEPTIQAIHERLPMLPIDTICIAINARKAKEQTQSLHDCEEAQMVMTKKWLPEAHVIQSEKNDQLYDAINRLPKDEKVVYCALNGIDLAAREINQMPISPLKLSGIIGKKIEEINQLDTMAKDHLYTYITGKRRTEMQKDHYIDFDEDLIDKKVNLYEEGVLNINDFVNELVKEIS